VLNVSEQTGEARDKAKEERKSYGNAIVLGGKQMQNGLRGWIPQDSRGALRK